MVQLTWKSSFFSNKVKIYSGAEQVGTIETNFFNSKVKASLYDTQLNFKRSGFFQERFKITQGTDSGDSGLIEGKVFSEKYQIKLGDDEPVIMCPKNFWKSKWILRSEGEKTVEFTGGFSGNVTLNEDADHAKVLAALFCMVQNNISSLIVIMVVVIIIAS